MHGKRRGTTNRFLNTWRFSFSPHFMVEYFNLNVGALVLFTPSFIILLFVIYAARASGLSSIPFRFFVTGCSSMAP